MHSGDLVILSTRSMIEYAKSVAYHLETFPDFRGTLSPREIVGKIAIAKFADGELEAEVRTSMRGKDVFLFGGAGRNPLNLSVEENKMEMYHCIDALRRAQAGRITLFEPYCSCARSDRITRRNSVGFWVHYKTLVSLGVDHIITFQLHSDKSKSIVNPRFCAIDDIPVNSLMEEYLCRTFVRSRENWKDTIQQKWVFCSVDAGSEGLAKKYAINFGCPLMIAHKQRDYHTPNKIETITLLTSVPLKEKTVWIIDDMVDTANSVYGLVHELKERGVESVNIAAVHPVFSGPAIQQLNELHENGLLNNIVVVNTVHCDEELQMQLPFLHVVDSARMSAEIIFRIHDEKPMSIMFESFDIETQLARYAHSANITY